MTLLKHAAIIGEWRVLVRASSIWHIGDGEDFLVDDDGYPFIPGTSIAGALRDAASSLRTTDENVVTSLFGTQNQQTSFQSSLFIYDAEINLERSHILSENRPNVRLDGSKGSARDKGKFERDYLLPNVVFSLSLRMFALDDRDYEIKANVIHELLAALRDGVVRFGAYKSSGAGMFSIEKLYHCRYDLRFPEQLLAYADEHLIGGHSEVTDSLQSQNSSNGAFHIRFEASLDSLMVGGHRDYKSKETDFISIRTDGGKTAIIPGTSLKGLLRHQARKIAFLKCKQKKNAEQLITFLFGSDPLDSSDELRAAHVIVNDVRLHNERKFTLPSTRLDKFTAGVRQGGLFKTEPVSGNADVEVLVRPARDCVDPTVEYAAHALLLFAVRDLAFGELPVGAKGGVGFGRMQSKQIEVKSGDRIAILDSSGMVTGNEQLLQDLLLTAWREVTGS